MKNKTNYVILRIVTVGLMAALVFIGNYFQIKIPNGGLVTRIHLGNSMCLLAGLLFGGIQGGLSSGIGAALYDMLDPVYITSAPYTFLSKFAMGFTAGILRRKGHNKAAVIGAAAAGQVVYIILYLAKTYVSQILLGEPSSVALAKVGVNALTSSINGILAVVIAVPLYFALEHSLRQTGFAEIINGRKSEPAKA
ncbi:MAG: ECF transporter S component [Oscillospiraceae bacterium]|nr:ECF transporter S component [Oscillospiraceae bacterium]